ncbi:MAG: hypothetical protein Q7T82_02340 [Armatimonadota bacterium]|nr:hypothetical protein [Armatimonadota bacterium]
MRQWRQRSEQTVQPPVYLAEVGANANKSIELQVGAKEALVDDHMVVLLSPIATVRGCAIIPLSFIVEQLRLPPKNPKLLTPR